MIRLVATDLDGTFWDSDLTVPRAHLGAVHELERRGVEVMAATSRRRRVVAHHLGRVGLAPSAVVLDGAMGVDLADGRRFHDAAFSVDAAGRVLEQFRRHGIEPCVYVDEAEVDVVVASQPSTSAAHLAYLGPITRTGDLDETVATPGVYSFSVTGRPRTELLPLGEDLARTGTEPLLFFEADYGGWTLLVAPPAVTKWNGILSHAARRGIAIDEILAVGDGDNDIEMLTRAGTAVGVRGGTERALAVADHRIDGPSSNGWAAIVDLLDS
ncbi:MAG TPA: HAD family hydrolase [Acidimicrobiales bacterium]|nr:HAD family hydrolase [Acidimicrobiales bacterium]